MSATKPVTATTVSKNDAGSKKIFTSHQSDEVAVPAENRDFADLFQAIKEDDAEYIKRNFERAIKARGWRSKSLLHKCAITPKATECCKLLAPVLTNKRDRDNMTALMLAARAGNMEAATILAPYEIGQTLWDGRAAVHFAIYSHYRNMALVKFLLRNGEANILWDGQSVDQLATTTWSEIVSPEDAQRIKEYMVIVKCPACGQKIHKIEIGGTHNRQCPMCNGSSVCTTPVYSHDRECHMKQ